MKSVYVVYILDPKSLPPRAQVVSHKETLAEAQAIYNDTDYAGFEGPVDAAKHPIGSWIESGDLL